MAHSYLVLTVREATPDDAGAVTAIHLAAWGGPIVVGHGVAYDLSTLPALVAVTGDGIIVGVLTWVGDDDSLEVVSIDATTPGQGAGTALLAGAVETARGQGLRRVWLITTNDNLDALRFYQRRGMRVVAVSPGAVDESRRIKPTIPDTGAYGIPIRDELVLELRLETSRPETEQEL